MSPKRKVGVSVISFPLGLAFSVPLSNLSRILATIDKTYVIIGTSDQTHFQQLTDALQLCIIPYQSGSSKIIQIFRYGMLQIKIGYRLFLLRENLKSVIFFMEPVPLIPMLVAKFVDIPIYWLLPSKIMQSSRGIVPKIEGILSKFCYWLSNGIIIYSASLLSFWHLEPYRYKVTIAHEHFLDFNAFTVTTPMSCRPPLIGYLGRLSEEKGILNFVHALPTILHDRQDLRVLIGGDGELKEIIKTSLQRHGLTDRVDLPGWIPHDRLPHFLNQLRLLVIPSYTEGLPNIMLEAMACRTPVLATPVGAIPDVIIDCKTGFIMEDNSPRCIAENVARALNSLKLEKIATDGKEYIEENYTFEKMVENWKKILGEIG